VHLANARMANSARAALDASGRFLLAANRAGRVLWSTPKLLRAALKAGAEGQVLPAHVREWLKQCTGSTPSVPETVSLTEDGAPLKLQLSFISQFGADEVLLRLVEGEANDDQAVLRQKLKLTQREAEVLLWVARGKSNRDIAEILTLSPRTVNKHLEQIFTKLGVENRTSAAALAVRTLGFR